jgi:hypothetical protein
LDLVGGCSCCCTSMTSYVRSEDRDLHGIGLERIGFPPTPAHQSFWRCCSTGMAFFTSLSVILWENVLLLISMSYLKATMNLKSSVISSQLFLCFANNLEYLMIL